MPPFQMIVRQEPDGVNWSRSSLWPIPLKIRRNQRLEDYSASFRQRLQDRGKQIAGFVDLNCFYSLLVLDHLGQQHFSNHTRNQLLLLRPRELLNPQFLLESF